MSETYKATPGSYREVTVQLRSIEEVVPPSIQGSQTFTADYTVQHTAQDNVSVYGRNGQLRVDIDKGSYSLIQRLRSAIGMIRGKNITVHGGAPDKATIETNPAIQQYLADSAAFADAMASNKAQREVLSDRRFVVTAKGAKEVPLEARLHR